MPARLLLIISALFFGAALPAAAQRPELTPFYRVLGPAANVLCGPFVREMTKGPGQADFALGFSVISWLHGYVSAYNKTLLKSPVVAGDLARGLSETDVLDWVADWCTQHPEALISTAADELVMYLFKRAESSSAQ
jgi:hypothetical protein